MHPCVHHISAIFFLGVVFLGFACLFKMSLVCVHFSGFDLVVCRLVALLEPPALVLALHIQFSDVLSIMDELAISPMLQF